MLNDIPKGRNRRVLLNINRRNFRLSLYLYAITRRARNMFHYPGDFPSQEKRWDLKIIGFAEKQPRRIEEISRILIE